MNIQSAVTPDKLADAGHVLYGERWQTPLAGALRVADRTMRRWLAGEAPIPDSIENELRELLIKRVNEMGGIIGYSVHPSERRVFHYPTAACFHYDVDENLTLLNPMMVAAEDVPLLTAGAREALRQEHERNQRGIRAIWVDQKNGRFASPAQIELEYNGCVISYPRIPTFSGQWTVNLASNNPYLLARLGENVVINSHVSLEAAVEEAKRRVDELRQEGACA